MESLQNIVVYASIALAAFYLFRRMVLPRFRKSGGGGCEKCAAHQAISDRPGVRVEKLSPKESARLRQEIENL